MGGIDNKMRTSDRHKNTFPVNRCNKQILDFFLIDDLNTALRGCISLTYAPKHGFFENHPSKILFLASPKNTTIMKLPPKNTCQILYTCT